MKNPSRALAGVLCLSKKFHLYIKGLDLPNELGTSIALYWHKAAYRTRRPFFGLKNTDEVIIGWKTHLHGRQLQPDTGFGKGYIELDHRPLSCKKKKH